MTELPVTRIEKVRVLIAEDRAQIGESLATVLAQQNSDFEMLAGAADGEQVIEFTRRYWPDVILMDLLMPRVDGITMVRRIRATAALCRIPVIFLTGQTSVASIIAGLSVGTFAYLSKTSAPGVLEGKVKRALGG